MFKLKTISTTKYVGIFFLFLVFACFAQAVKPVVKPVIPLTEEQLRVKFGDAVSVYRKTCDKVNGFFIWTISGEVTQRGPESTSLWGFAMTSSKYSRPPASHPGWMRGKGNIIIKFPKQEGFAYNTYTGDHVYVGETTGNNAYGGVVSIKVFGPLPKEYWQAIAARNTAINQVQAAQDALVSQLQQTWDSKVKANPTYAQIYEEYSTKCMELCKFIHERGFEAHDVANDAVVLKAKAIIAFLNAGDVDQGTTLIEQILLMTEPDVNVDGRPDYQFQKNINQSLYTDRSEVSADFNTTSDQDKVNVSDLTKRVFGKYPQLLQMIATAYIKVLPDYFVTEKDSIKSLVTRTAVAQFCNILPNEEPIKKQLDIIIATNVGMETINNKINQKDGAELIFIPAGEFLMGSANTDKTAIDNEKPQRRVYLDAYYMYKTEVTVAQYIKFCIATNRKMPTEPDWKWQDTHPIVNVNWYDAKAYADWAGAMLPTEAQWEKAARGTNGRIYPWGNEWNVAKCVNSVKSTKSVGSRLLGSSPYGCLDMAGNSWEWCADWYGSDYYKTAPAKNPIGPDKGTSRVLRGGSWDKFIEHGGDCRCAFRNAGNPDICEGDNIGFRCVAPLIEPTNTININQNDINKKDSDAISVSTRVKKLVNMLHNPDVTVQNNTVIEMQDIASTFFNKDNIEQAKVIYQELCKYKPDNALFKLRYAETLYGFALFQILNEKSSVSSVNKDLIEADTLLKSVALMSTEYAPEAIYFRGDLASTIEAKPYTEAKDLFLLLANTYPKDEYAEKALYRLIFFETRNDGDFNKAQEYVKRMQENYPKSSQLPEAYVLIAEYYYQRKKFVESKNIYQEIIKRCPDYSKIDVVLYFEGMCYYLTGSLDSTKPDMDAYNNSIKKLLEFKDKYEKSKYADDALYWASSACINVGDKTKAVELLKKLIISYPDGDKKSNAQKLLDSILDTNKL